MPHLGRRHFLKLSTATSSLFFTAATQAQGSAEHKSATTQINWLDGPPAENVFQGTTFGAAWPQGAVRAPAHFSLGTSDAGTQQIQSWITAWWPDGSVKWSAHAVSPTAHSDLAAYTRLHAVPARHSETRTETIAQKTDDQISVNTGKLQASFSKGQSFLSLSFPRQAQVQAITLLEQSTQQGEITQTRTFPCHGDVHTLEIEGNGPDRAVIRIEGKHSGPDHTRVIPFIFRFYFYKNSGAIRVIHSIIHDIDSKKYEVRGLGLNISSQFHGEAYNRHIRFVSADGGVFAEALQPLTGLRRDPGSNIRSAQTQGQAVPPEAEWSPKVSGAIGYVPVYGDYTLTQATCDGFSLKKRITKHDAWINSFSGQRASGTVFLGDVSGGVVLGIRNFWQSYPAALSVENGGENNAQLTAWLWAPDAEPMQMAPYQTPENQNDYTTQRQALDITYEDYEPGFSSSYGVGRTSEIVIEFTDHTPDNTSLAAIAERISSPPQLRQSLPDLFTSRATHAFWSPEHPQNVNSKVNQALDTLFTFYRNQIEQRRWYGFWDYGDIMHTYDADRHTWRYDIGGFAWDNGELSSVMWFWAYHLHKGNAESFRQAEAMTRHITEVDVYHIGKFAPLGSRHNVQHWGDSAKQLRISSVANAKIYYFLTADERTGELLRAQVNAVNRLQDIVPGRKTGGAAVIKAQPHHATVSFGTDWGAIAAAWLLEWERTGDEQWKNKLLASMTSIAAQPHGFFTGLGVMDLHTGEFAQDRTGALSVSHLSAMFGLPETCSELIMLLPQPDFKNAWLDYCTLYLADAQNQKNKLGQALHHLNLRQAHARLLAYAGYTLRDTALRRQAWRIFAQGDAGLLLSDFQINHLSPPTVPEAVDEAPHISTNAAAQWGLGATGLMALAPQEENIFYETL